MATFDIVRDYERLDVLAADNGGSIDRRPCQLPGRPAGSLALRRTYPRTRRRLTGCAYRKSNPAILMVQSAQDRAADDIPGPLNAAMHRGILVQ